MYKSNATTCREDNAVKVGRGQNGMGVKRTDKKQGQAELEVFKRGIWSIMEI